MWKCTKCGEELEDTFDTCWNCGEAGEGASHYSRAKRGDEKVESVKEPPPRERNRPAIGLCPFSWIQVFKPAGCPASLFGGKGEFVTEPQPCMTSRCQLWDSSAGDCGLVTKK